MKQEEEWRIENLRFKKEVEKLNKMFTWSPQQLWCVRLIFLSLAPSNSPISHVAFTLIFS